MKKIKTTSYKVLSLIFTILTTAPLALSAPSSLGFTMQFSKNSTLVELHVNYGGMQSIITTHESSMPKITLEIPKSNDQWHFDVLVTPTKIDYQFKQFAEQETIQNTVDYLKIDPQASYKYYSLDFIDDAWDVKEQELPASGQIPDRAIIIECYPEWIKDFKGGSCVELPTLYLNNAMDELGITQDDFNEALVKLELTALDSKITHPTMRRKTQTLADKKRILIMDLIT